MPRRLAVVHSAAAGTTGRWLQPGDLRVVGPGAEQAETAAPDRVAAAATVAGGVRGAGTIADVRTGAVGGFDALSDINLRRYSICKVNVQYSYNRSAFLQYKVK